jgi:iron complex outermembrane receptor protein
VDRISGGSEVPGSRTAFDADVHTTGLYLEAQYRPCDYFKALAGIRQEKHSTFGTENLPLLGAVINAGEATVFKISHGRHFLAPTPNDLFWPNQDFGIYSFEGNPDLKPETGWHSDATVEHRFWENRAFAFLTYFQWDVNDKIQWQPDENWHYRPVNLDRFEGQGLEAGLDIGPYRQVTFGLAYTYTDAEEENAFVTRRATYTPEHQFKGTLTHWAPFGLTSQMTIRYVGERLYYGSDKRLTEPVGTLDAYWTVDLRLAQRLFDHWVVSLSANNLLDAAYDTYLSPFYDYSTEKPTLEGFPGARRSIFIKLSYAL